MKISFGKKLVLFLHWLLSLVICALAVGLLFWNAQVQNLLSNADRLMAGWGDIAGIAALAVYALLSVLCVVFIFSNPSKRSERGFITVDSSEAGRTRIAIGAVDQMIRQAVRGVEGIIDMKTGIINCEDAVSINTAVTIVSGAHVPTITMNIQRAVRSYIELNCGVAVREVSVSVNAMENAEDGGKHGRRKAAAPVSVPVAPAIQPVVEEVPAAAAEPVEEIKLTLEPEAETEAPVENSEVSE